MIVFDLQCSGGHVFEAWFGSSDAFADQKQRGLVQCPVCETLEVEKAVMAPRLAAKGNSAPSPAEVKTLMTAMAAAQKAMLAKSDYVGDRFVAEARAIHIGEADARSIWGSATKDQADSLASDGIPVAPLPFRAVPPAEEN